MPVECFGVLLALFLAVVATAHIVMTDRSWMVFYDTESVMPAIVRNSVLIGEPQHWSLSAVLFIPEMALFWSIATIVPGAKAAFLVNAVVNLLLVYGTIRVLAASALRGRSERRQVAASVVALIAIVVLIQFDTTRHWDSLELPSLLLTDTFYLATLLAFPLAAAATISAVAPRHARNAQGERQRGQSVVRPPAALVALFAVSAVSVLTNPLYVAWVGVPLLVVVVLLRRRLPLGWRSVLSVAVALLGGSAVGFVARLPFAALIGKSSSAYADPTRPLVTFVYYLRLLVHRLADPLGVVSIGCMVVLFIASVFLFRHTVRRAPVGIAVLAGLGWVAPLIVGVGVLTVGAVGSRYLQPLYFAPVLALIPAAGLVKAPRRLPRIAALPRIAGLRLPIASVVVGVATAALIATTLVPAAGRVDTGITCVDNWITASGQTGAGSYWTIRGPKAYLPDPRQLVQVNQRFNGYAWLTDRADFARRRVSFILADTANPTPAVPHSARKLPHTEHRCGRYVILDYGSNVLPIGPVGGPGKP